MPKPKQPSVVIRVTPTTLAKTIDLATDYLVRHCQPNGRFVYLRHVNPARDRPHKYNLLRHAGAIYALGMAYARAPDPSVLAAMKRAAGYLRQSLGPGPGDPPSLALWSPPRAASAKRPTEPAQAKLGGAGLGLVGLLSLERFAPGATPKEQLQGLGLFIQAMQKPAGDFYAKYYAGLGPDKTWASLYYPGEAMLGLLMLQQNAPDPRWLEVVGRGMAHLAASRRAIPAPPADHWALLATRQLLSHWDPAIEKYIDRATVLAHAKKIAGVMLDEQCLNPTVPAVHGSFLNDARTCPAAIRLEGLLALYGALPDAEAGLRKRIAEAVHLGIAFLVRSQVKTGELAGGIPRATILLPPSDANRAFNARAAEIRIDYVQHALSAFIGYEAAFIQPPGKK